MYRRCSAIFCLIHVLWNVFCTFLTHVTIWNLYFSNFCFDSRYMCYMNLFYLLYLTYSIVCNQSKVCYRCTIICNFFNKLFQQSYLWLKIWIIAILNSTEANLVINPIVTGAKLKYISVDLIIRYCIYI